MNNKKEILQNLFLFIKELISKNENSWLKESLSQLLEKPDSHKTIQNTSQSIENKIDLIQKYLSIDVNKLIDYSDFQEPAREQLFRDCLEMCRHEKGLINNKINYPEFVRYVHLQAEELINYFFTIKFDKNIKKVELFIKTNYAKYKADYLPENLNDIKYYPKLESFSNHVQLPKNYKRMLHFYNKLRNETSHRNSLSEAKDDETLTLCEKNGILKNDKFKIDFETASSFEIDLYNKAQHIINKRKEDFSQAYKVLKSLRDYVLNNLNTDM